MALQPGAAGVPNLYDDWASVSAYSGYFLFGAAIARSPGLEAALRREAGRALGIAAAACAFLLVGMLGRRASAGGILLAATAAGWSLVVAIVGFAGRHLSRAAPAPPYLVESALPVYVLHQAGIVLPGFWIVKLPLGIEAKFALLLGASFALTMGVYHFVVRPFGLARFLTGMRPPILTDPRQPPLTGALRPG
jgi:hypothetical protein